MVDLTSLIVRHRRVLRIGWLLVLLALAACQPDSNGGGDPGGGDGY